MNLMPTVHGLLEAAKRDAMRQDLERAASKLIPGFPWSLKRFVRQYAEELAEAKPCGNGMICMTPEFRDELVAELRDLTKGDDE